MGFRMIAPKRVRKVKTPNGQEVLRRLEEHLKSAAVTGEPVEILCGFWKDQQDAITYQELRQAVAEGAVGQETLEAWSQDYSILVADKLRSMWTASIAAGASMQPILDGRPFEFNMQAPGIQNWIRNRGAEFVTACSREQKDAIAALLEKKMRDGHTVDELSRLIRPCIGLTERDARASARLYDSIVENLKKEHPRMKPESIRKKALDATQKYAEKKHRARAMTIAQTESAFAYNRGADEGVRQAQAQGLLGPMIKRWSTSGDDRVCSICQGLEGVEFGMDEGFKFRGRKLFAGQDLLPPAHPRCACAVEYVEAEEAGIRRESFAGYEQNDFTNVYEDDTIGASNSAMAGVRKPKNAIERSQVINEAINADSPNYAADLRRAYVQYGVKPLEGYYDVVIHGASQFVEYEHKYILDAETLYYIISGRKDYHMEDIRLLSCSTGKINEKGDCVAQNLADMLGVNVYAPVDVLNIHPDGTLSVGRNKDKTFKLFKPRR